MTSQIRFDLFLKSIVTFIVLFFFCKTVVAQDNDFWAYIRRWVNRTPYEYHVYKNCSPTPYADQVEWERMIRLAPYESKHPLNSVAILDILFKDPQGQGCTIKLEPIKDDRKLGAKTYYIKAGKRASGSCLYDWADGPHDIIVSPVLFQLFDQYQSEYNKKGKKIIKERFRYCGYQNTSLSCEILKEGVSFAPWHRSFVLDNKVSNLMINLDDQKKDSDNQDGEK